MGQVILGRNLLTDSEIVRFSRSRENINKLDLITLRKLAYDASLLSAMALIRISKSLDTPSKPDA